MRRVFSMAVAACFAADIALAQTAGMETGWMDLVKGQVDSESGATVQEVSSDPETGERRLVISIPKEALQDESMMEEVRVVGRAPDKIEIELPEFETQWVADYDSDYYGLLVRLKNGPDTPIRLFFNAAGAGGVVNDVGGPQP